MVRQHGSRPAISFSPGEFICYDALDKLSNQAAHYLLDQKVKKGDRVGLCLEKCASFYILVLACLKIGAVYFAYDPKNPAQRNKSILDQCEPAAVFSHENCPQGSGLPTWLKGYSDAAPVESSSVGGEDPAYIMFTSGSTGTPKGAVMSHDNLEHFILWLRKAYGFTPEDVHTHLNPVFFDNTVFDIYSTLFTGGQLVPFTHAQLLDPGILAQRLREMKCTIWFSVPSLLLYLQVMKVTTPEHFGQLRHIIFGGEVFPKSKLKALMEALGSKIHYYNVSGPTECTCICSSYRVTEADFEDMEGAPALGSLTACFKGVILDDDDKVVQEGEVGELCLSGPCVGLGYFGRPELTRDVFTQNPVNSHSETIYRTGDLVRMDPRDHKLYFIGRKDLQIKHMGYRIELEEIQHALMLCPGVEEAAVFYKKSDDAGEIVGVVASQKVLETHLLRSELERRLPRYMMPSRFYFVRHLPKNANGKTDRQALIRQLGS